jgi:GntR family transcriptional regulator
MRFTLSQASGVPFYRQIERHFADRIRAGQLAPGTPLPSVRQLAVDLVVSVITVKQAYAALEAAGLVVSQQGRGTFVAEGAAASARGRLAAEIAADVDAAVHRAADLRIERAPLEEAFRRSLDRYFPEKKR